MKHHHTLLGTILLVATLSLVFTEASALERGDTGYGITVMQGTEPTRFEVEILGVMESWGSTGNTILARLSGADLEKTGVLQGMSGSPVYVDGELIGAVASTWGFAAEPMAGIRPIEEMRRLADDLESGIGEAVELVRTPGEAGGLVWAASGFAPDLFESMAGVLGTDVVQAAAVRGEPDEGTIEGTLEAGDAVSILLVDGDARLFATGTVTERIGDTVLAFGHPFLGAGPVSLPMARAEVVTVMPSRQISFKMAVPTQVVGALQLDRRAGVSGRLGERADTVPLELGIEGAAAGSRQSYRFEVARMQGLTAQLVGWAVQSAIADRRELGANYGVTARIEANLADGTALRSEASMLGAGAAQRLAAEVALPVQLLVAARDGAPRLESMKIDLVLEPGARGATIGRVQIDDPRLRPGESLRVRVELLERERGPRWQEMRIDVPANLRPGPYRLHVNDGNRAFGEEIARSPERWSDLGMRQIREALALRRPATEIIAVLYGPSTSLITRGVEREDLPGTHLLALGRTHVAQGDPASIVTPLARTSVDVGTVVSGGGVLDLVVEGPAVVGPPLPADGGQNRDERGRNGGSDRRE